MRNCDRTSHTLKSTARTHIATYNQSGFAPAHRNLRPHIATRNLRSHIASHALIFSITDTIFDTDAYKVPEVKHKTQPFWVKVIHQVPNVYTLAGHAVGAIHLARTTTLYLDTVHKTKYLFPHWIFYFLLK